MTRAKILARLGRNDAAIDELRAAQLQGNRLLWDFDFVQRLDRVPAFETIRDDPRFRAVIADMEADNRMMRDRVLKQTSAQAAPPANQERTARDRLRIRNRAPDFLSARLRQRDSVGGAFGADATRQRMADVRQRSRRQPLRRAHASDARQRRAADAGMELSAPATSARDIQAPNVWHSKRRRS